MMRSSATGKSIISCVEPLGFPFKTADPFLFCVYHKDAYPAGDELMQAPKKGNGADFDWSKPYRMYHGDRIPGFPQHPHRGFETQTCTIEGLVDHSDSKGNAGRYGNGDLQWMTAGAGLVHGEMFPLINKDKPNPCRFFQLWMNLPAKSKMCEPSFKMFWHEDVPRVESKENKSKVTVWAGNFLGAKGLSPPPDSWAADKYNHVAILFIQLGPLGSVSLPKVATMGKKSEISSPEITSVSSSSGGGGSECKGETSSTASAESKYSSMKVKDIILEVDKRRLSRAGLSEKHELINLLEEFDKINEFVNINRIAYFIEGNELVINDDEKISSKKSVTLHSDQDVVFKNPSTESSIDILVLQGRPIGEPVAQQGPFVMNTDEEIRQAYADYRKTQFGGWPWPKDAMVFPRDKGRFALMSGKEEGPPVPPPSSSP